MAPNVFKLTYKYSFGDVKPKRDARTNWDLAFDNKPTSSVPRIKFSHSLSEQYLRNVNSFLEIGCGTGSYTTLVDRKGCIGIDINIPALNIARKYCPKSEFIAASALSLPFKDEPFDLVFVWGVFEEIPLGAEKKLIIEARRVLKKNCFFILSAYTNNIFSRLFDPAHLLRGVRHYDVKSLLKLISDVGFQISTSTVRGRSNTIMSNFLVYFYKHILHKKAGTVKKFFDERTEVELCSETKEGIVYVYITARKIER